MMHILNHILRAGVFLVVLGACAEPTHINGSCNVSADCHTRENRHAIGSICNEAILRCECPQGSVTCCPDGVLPGTCAATCSPSQACSALPGFAADAGSDDASAEDAAGPDADAGPAPECEHDAQCPDAPYEECGQGRCIAGRCELEILVGPIASQKYGDCKRRECTELGNLKEVTEANDTYNDMNDCTDDFCTDEGPVNSQEEDGTPCAKNSGYCYQGGCVECIGISKANTCDDGLVCDHFWCEPLALCMNGECGGDCAPCGIGSPCLIDSDCVGNACIDSVCKLPTCDDGRMSGAEPGLDCGGPSCPPCPDGEGCQWPTDCNSGVCKYGVCEAATCIDGIHNGDEGGVDCGGPCPECL